MKMVFFFLYLGVRVTMMIMLVRKKRGRRRIMMALNLKPTNNSFSNTIIHEVLVQRFAYSQSKLVLTVTSNHGNEE